MAHASAVRLRIEGHRYGWDMHSCRRTGPHFEDRDIQIRAFDRKGDNRKVKRMITILGHHERVELVLRVAGFSIVQNVESGNEIAVGDHTEGAAGESSADACRSCLALLDRFRLDHVEPENGGHRLTNGGNHGNEARHYVRLWSLKRVKGGPLYLIGNVLREPLRSFPRLHRQIEHR